MDINNLSIVFLRDYKKEWFYISNKSYLNYSPVSEPEKEIYKITHPDRYDTVTYIKHKYKDYWLYYEDQKLTFKPLQVDNNAMYKVHYKQPVVLYFYYLGDAEFFLYYNNHFAHRDIDYLVYKEIDNKIYTSFSKDINKATRFRYKYIQWKEELNHNLLGKALHQGIKNIHFGK